MMRMTMAAMGFAAVMGALPMAGAARAQTVPHVASAQAATEIPAQRRRPRARVRIYREDESRGVYPRYNPGPNAVRECTANLVQEFRPSGTVIVPRMNCYWRPG
jgi:hypothetical protein